MQASRTPVKGHDPEEDGLQYPRPPEKRKKVVVVGLGMVGIAFMYVPRSKFRLTEDVNGLFSSVRSLLKWMQRGENTTSSLLGRSNI